MTNRILILLFVFLLASCKTTEKMVDPRPVSAIPHWPEISQDLMKSCPDLKKVQEGTEKLSEVLNVVADNYSQYHECRAKVDSWIRWYNAQHDIFEKLK
jgi:hypothetical protein